MADITKLYNQQGSEYEIVDSSLRSSLSNSLTEAQVINLIYPINSIYISTNSANPSTFLTGTTWVQLENRFLLNAGNTYTAGSTGGNASCTLTTAQMPSHNHTFSGTQTTSGNQSAGHTHNGTTAGQSQNHTHTGTSGNPSANHTHTGPSHTHPWQAAPQSSGSYSDPKYVFVNETPDSFWGYKKNIQSTKTAGTGTTGGISRNHTHTTTTGGVTAGHTHTITLGNQSQGHTHQWTASGTIGSKGSGESFNVMPPYLVVYIWKRTA